MKGEKSVRQKAQIWVAYPIALTLALAGFLVKISIVRAGATMTTTAAALLPAAAASGSASPPEYCTQCVRS